MSTPISLSQLAGLIKQQIDQAFHAQHHWVVADVVSHTFKESSNYHYFELVEKAGERGDILAKLSAKAWGAGSTKIAQFERTTGQRFDNNIRVLVCVSVTYHARFGLQLELQDIDPSYTLGAMEAQKQATLKRLVEANPTIVQLVDGHYITQNKRLSLPPVIQHIALVSAAQSAGAEDFRHSLAHNEYGYRFFLDEFHAPVQGEHHAETLLECLVKVFTVGKPYDAVVITRGGGGQTDFLIFDDYKIGLAVAKFPIPVITGIGHQKNETIADLMAHTSLKTPTKVAEFIIAHNKAFEDRILTQQKMVVIKSQQLFSARMQSLAALQQMVVNQSRDIISIHKDQMAGTRQLILRDTRELLYGHKSDLQMVSSMITTKPRSMLSNQQSELKNIRENLRSFHAQFLKNQRGYLNHLQTVIKLMHPDNILKKGFALVRAKGKITSNPDDLKKGEAMEVILSGVEIQSTVISKKTYDGNEFDL